MSRIFVALIGVSIGGFSHLLPDAWHAPIYAVAIGMVILVVTGMTTQVRNTGQAGFMFATPRNLRKLANSTVNATELLLLCFGGGMVIGVCIGLAFL
jgi:hypothetical protein